MSAWLRSHSIPSPLQSLAPVRRTGYFLCWIDEWMEGWTDTWMNTKQGILRWIQLWPLDISETGTDESPAEQ